MRKRVSALIAVASSLMASGAWADQTIVSKGPTPKPIKTSQPNDALPPNMAVYFCLHQLDTGRMISPECADVLARPTPPVVTTALR